jgi:hypothetical protein
MPVGYENIYTGFREDRFNPRNQYEVIRTEKFNQSLSSSRSSQTPGIGRQPKILPFNDFYHLSAAKRTSFRICDILGMSAI